jgi:hypothetical protein
MYATATWSDTVVRLLQVKKAKQEAEEQMQQDLNIIVTQHNLIIDNLHDQLEDFDERFQVRHVTCLAPNTYSAL